MKWLLVVLLAACGSKPAPLPKETNVELIGRGKEPYRELRYQLKKGSSTTLVVELESKLVERKTPRVITDLAFTVEDIAPDGRATIASTVQSTKGVMPDGSAVPSELVSFFDGTRIRATMSPVGTLSDTKVIPGPNPLPSEDLANEVASLPKMFEQTAVPLPNAPVGVGAQWRTRKAIDENGVKINSVSTLTITAMTDHTITLERSTQLSGPDQTVQNGGIDVALSQINGSGHGTLTIDLATFDMTLSADDSYTAKVLDRKTPGAQPEPFGVAMTMSIKKK